MPNKAASAKSVRQSAKRRDRNRADRATFRTSLKGAEKSLESGDAKAGAAQLAETLKVIGKTQKKGLIHKNKAARHASRLMKKLNAVKAKA